LGSPEDCTNADTGLVRFGARDYDAFAGGLTAKDSAEVLGADTNCTHTCVVTQSIGSTRRVLQNALPGDLPPYGVQTEASATLTPAVFLPPGSYRI